MSNELPSRDVATRARSELVSWLDSLSDNPVVDEVVAITESGVERWFVRLLGDAKDVYSVWFVMGQRTLAFETYVMPSPEENHAEFFEMLLRRNDRLSLISFTVGEENAVFLKGRVELDLIDEAVLDQILGAFYEAIELCFLPAIRIGFATRFGK